MLRLIDLDPQWINHGERRGLGVRFRCMAGHCEGYQWILFANPLDGGPAYDGKCYQLMSDLSDKIQAETGHYIFGKDRPCDPCRWTRTGEDFATMSMSPSVNAHECGHLTLTNGVFG